MFRATQPVLEDVVGEAAALADLADADDLGHEPEARVGLAQAVAVRAGALRVRAEQRRLDAVRLRERRPDRVEDAGVGRRVRAPRAADRGLVDDRHRRVGPGQAAVDQRALAGARDAGHRDEHAERHVDRDVLEVVEPGVPDRDRAARRRAAPASAPGGRRGGGRWPSPDADEAVDRALEHDGPAVRAGARAHVDDVVGDPDDLRVVLDDEDRVALVAQAPEQRSSSARRRGRAARSSARRRRT